MVLSCQNISKSFGTDVILDNVSFHVNEHEKCAIVGINGAGKSTLLKIITGELSADSGQVQIAKGSRLGYLSQQQNLDPANTIYDEVMTVKAELIAIEQNLRRIEQRMKEADPEELDALYKKYDELNHIFESQNGYAIRSEVTGVLKGLGFDEADFSLPVGTLSGGQKTRTALAKLLLSRPDIILLDEPTNHLDIDSIAWLESFLSGYTGSVVIVAHDRYFLDKIVDQVVEIENSKAEVFTGNYTAYSVKKQQERANRLKAYLNQQKVIQHQEKVIETLRSYNREKSIKRAESRQKQLDKIERIPKPVELNDKMHIILEPNILSGNDVLTVEDLAKSFDGLKLFEHLGFEIKRGDRVAIIGNNGTGKTTLLKILNGLINADEGEYRFGAKVYPGYYDQEHHVLTDSNTVFDEIQNTYPDEDNLRVRNLLAAFLFTGDDVLKLVGSLSGGEKARVSLAKLMMSDANFLMLDEPTNHLDIASKEILEEAISGYTGTVLYVSHDRYFINRTATRVFELDEGILYIYNGNYDYYLDKRDAVKNAHYTGTASAAGSSASSANDSGRDLRTQGAADWETQKKEAAARRKLENEFKTCENKIKTLEDRNAEIDRLFLDDTIVTDAVRLRELTEEKESNEALLETLLETWESLYERLN
ncbi:MAG: ATP-binding cassette domain-containing protein [Lachnospiraceae bacterium]|nr:ATP-binding cassette domain-containing protein [Lachnospiraceae bacterium]